MKSLGKLVMEANIEEIAMGSLRMQGLEEENERLKARVTELEEKLDNLHASWRDGSIGIHMDMGDIEKRVDDIDLLVTALVVVYGERFIGLDSDG